jgi:hypothetical protein
MINETYGYAVFRVKVPYTYPGTAIDLYANFYDGGFQPLPSSYFVTRLPVSPREVTLRFVVFENEEYDGLVYVNHEVSSPQEIFEVEKASSLRNYKQISPVEWEVVVNASSPFVLVFTEPYDRLWRAYVNGKEVEPVALYNVVNGFTISETGTLHIRIYYTLQTYLNAGLLTSGLSFAVLVSLCAYQGLRKRLSGGPRIAPSAGGAE